MEPSVNTISDDRSPGRRKRDEELASESELAPSAIPVGAAPAPVETRLAQGLAPAEFHMATNYTAIIQKRDPWWVGWVEEIAGVNSQGATREELIENLQSALQEALEMNRAEARASCLGPYEEVGIPT